MISHDFSIDPGVEEAFFFPTFLPFQKLRVQLPHQHLFAIRIRKPSLGEKLRRDFKVLCSETPTKQKLAPKRQKEAPSGGFKRKMRLQIPRFLLKSRCKNRILVTQVIRATATPLLAQAASRTCNVGFTPRTPMKSVASFGGAFGAPNAVCGARWGRLRRPQWTPQAPKKLNTSSFSSSSSTGVCLDGRPLGRHFWRFLEIFASRKSPRKCFGRILLARISGPSRPADRNLLKFVGFS